jgi:hypothetical protein
MKAARSAAAFFSLVFSAAGLAADEVPPTPAATPQSASQHVTAPSLPGQPNREGTVKPEGGLPTDSEGYAITKRYDPSATPPQAAPQAGAKPAPAPGAPGAPSAAPPAAQAIPIGPAPTGKAMTTGANYVTVRGSLVALETGKSVTIKLQKTGKENTYTLAEGATVGADLKPGQVVRVRVLAAQKGKVADRVELVPPAKPSPAGKDVKP